MFVTDVNYATLGRAILDRTDPAQPTGTFAAPTVIFPPTPPTRP
jgi:hypothetical protein